MKVERIAEMRLTPNDEAQIGSLLNAAFGTEFGGRSYYQQRHQVRLVVREVDKIIGHMAICLRAIRMGDQIVQIAGLAEVAADPAHRGRGIATHLMAAAIAEVRQSVAQFFVLFGDQPLYATSGFVAKPNVVRALSCFDVRMGDVVEIADDGLMVMALSDVAWDDTAVIDLVGHPF